MLQATVNRLLPVACPSHIFVMTGRAYAEAVRRQLPSLSAENIVAEPIGRGSGPALALGAALIARRDPDAIVGSFAADHHIGDPEAFRAAVLAAADVALKGRLVAIGIQPTYPETGYGYIRSGPVLFERGGFTARLVEEFKEKPNLKTAERYLTNGNYLWNASMFVWRAATLLEAIQELFPEMHMVVTEIAAAWDSAERNRVMDDLWPTLPEVTNEHQIMERSTRMAVVPAHLDWTDVGDWNRLAQLMVPQSEQNVVLSGTHISEDTRSSLVLGNSRPVVTIGLENVLIVDAGDVLLVCDRDRVQDIRGVVERSHAAGHVLLP